MEFLTPEENTLIAVAYSRRKNHYVDSLDYRFIKHLFYSLLHLDYPDELKALLVLSNELKVDFPMLFTKTTRDEELLSHCCLVDNPESFKLITDFGAANGYHRYLCRLYLTTSSSAMHNFDFKMSNEVFYRPIVFRYTDYDYDGAPFKMRTYQLFCLYAFYKHGGEHHPTDYEVSLRILWSSIPDPFLTITEFTRTFEWLETSTMKKAMEAWNWYCELVRGDDVEEKCPRSLQHLSRCAIRRRLKECFRLPNGVEELDAPRYLKQYLLLRDIETELSGARQNKEINFSQCRQYYVHIKENPVL